MTGLVDRRNSRAKPVRNYKGAVPAESESVAKRSARKKLIPIIPMIGTKGLPVRVNQKSLHPNFSSGDENSLVLLSSVSQRKSAGGVTRAASVR